MRLTTKISQTYSMTYYPKYLFLLNLFPAGKMICSCFDFLHLESNFMLSQSCKNSCVRLAIDSDSHSEPHSIFEPLATDSHSEPDSEQHSIFESMAADSHSEPDSEQYSIFEFEAAESHS